MKEVPFRANDIRGIFPDEVDEPLFYHLGLILPSVLKTKKIAIGRDIRLSSNSLFSMLCEGLNDAGCTVLDLGLCDTPYTYFISGKYKLPVLMITASHNPKEYNGLKIINKNSIPLNGNQIKDMLSKLEKLDHHHKKRSADIKYLNKRKEYISFILSQIDTRNLTNLKIIVDCSNGVAPVFFKDVLSKTPAKVIYINDRMDGSFPSHQPNPAIKENLSQLQKMVKKEKADLGIIFDGDCDRVAFVDEKGEIIDSSITASLFTHHFLHSKPNKIVFTSTSGMVLRETIENYGGSSILAKVGHRFIKESMIKNKAIFGSEPSGHYYFKSNFFADSGLIGAILFYEIISLARTPVSVLTRTFHKYESLGEINYKVKDRDKSFTQLRKMIKSMKPIMEINLDGYAAKIRKNGNLIYSTIRKSNTEPYIRVTMESNSISSAKQLKKQIDKILK